MKGRHKTIFGPDGGRFCDYCGHGAPFPDGGCGGNLIHGKINIIRSHSSFFTLFLCAAPPRDSVPHLHEDPNEENPSKSSDQEPDAGNDGRKLRSSSRGATGVMSVLSERAANTGTSAAPTKSEKVSSAEEDEAYWEGESELQKWYARHNGLLFLSEENIARCCNNV